MKIKVSYLKQIIKEETEKLLKEIQTVNSL